MNEQSPSQSNSSPDFGLVLRLLGVVVLFFGISIAYTVVNKAWLLFEDSNQVIKPISTEIEKRSNIDKYFNKNIDPILKIVQQQPQFSSTTTTTTQAPATDEPSQLHISYFIAWIIVIVLLGLIAKISVLLITAGAGIAAESQFRKHSDKLIRRLITEMRIKPLSGNS